MRLLLSLVVALAFSSCVASEEAENETNQTTQTRSIERTELSLDSKIFLGNRLFSEKTCITCHAIDHKKVGPSVIEIIAAYKDNNSKIEAFLKGESDPIVDTTASQVAIMQANIDGFLKKITDEELDAITTYMVHVVE